MTRAHTTAAPLETLLHDPFVWQRSERWEDEPHVSCDLETRATVWHFPERPVRNPHLFTELSAIAKRLRDERAAAPERVNRLLNMDPSGWRPLIQSDPSYRSIGVVEGILAAVDKTAHLTCRCFELTTLTTEIVQFIDESWPPLLVAQLHCDVWREHAWALVNLGRYLTAEEAAHRAVEYVAPYGALAVEGALAQYMEGSAVYRQGRHIEAWKLAQRAALTFRAFGDHKRFVKARLLEGLALYDAQKLQQSTELWQSLIAQAKALGDRVTLAHLHNYLGNAMRSMGKLPRARWYLQHALTMFEELGKRYAQEIPRVRMTIARVTLQTGKLARALTEMQGARRLFAALQASSGVAAAELDIVEILIVMGRFEEAYALCERLPGVFREFGMVGNELEAAAFLKECASGRQLHVPHVQHVREYLRDLPQNPGRPFVRRVEAEG